MTSARCYSPTAARTARADRPRKGAARSSGVGDRRCGLWVQTFRVVKVTVIATTLLHRAAPLLFSGQQCCLHSVGVIRGCEGARIAGKRVFWEGSLRQFSRAWWETCSGRPGNLVKAVTCRCEKREKGGAFSLSLSEAIFNLTSKTLLQVFAFLLFVAASAAESLSGCSMYGLCRTPADSPFEAKSVNCANPAVSSEHVVPPERNHARVSMSSRLALTAVFCGTYCILRVSSLKLQPGHEATASHAPELSSQDFEAPQPDFTLTTCPEFQQAACCSVEQARSLLSAFMAVKLCMLHGNKAERALHGQPVSSRSHLSAARNSPAEPAACGDDVRPVPGLLRGASA